MRRSFSIAICLAAWLPATAGAAIIDRIAVSVGNRVITEMDLDREIRITAFLNNQKPDFTPANKRRTAERLVDQTLVRSELDASRYLPPTADETASALAEEKVRFGNDEAYRRALAEYGISEDDLKARLSWQIMLLRFIDARFRPGIQIGDEEIRKYFDEHIHAPSIDPYRESIEKILIGQAEDQQMEQWLKEARRRTHIQYHDEAFQ